MSLCLIITSYHKITPGLSSEKTLDKGEMTIGRSPDNSWVLADPERLVSSKHCVIKYIDGRYFLTDHSTNGVELINAGIRLRRGNSEPLQDGEVIAIGEYQIQVRLNLDSDMPGSRVGVMAEAESFEALMSHQNEPVTPLASAPSVAQLQGSSGLDTFPDLFDFLSPSRLAPASRPDHVPAERHDFRPPVPLDQSASKVTEEAEPKLSVIPQNWDLLAAAQPATEAATAAEPVSPNDFPADPVAPLDPAMTAPPTSLDSTLLSAFLRGAGLDQLRLERAQAEAQMESIGRSYRLMVEGLIDVLRARTSLKGEFRMQQTMIRPMENNPLKFAPNVDEALLLLLRPTHQAFMAPDQAIADSFDDLRGHQLAVMAGVEAAIKALLRRFEPAELERRMGAPTALSNWFGSHKAQYWQQFTALYAQISREAEDDFQDLFGREFSRAYEAHNARLQGL